MNSEHLIDIIIPAYNSAAYIEETIATVQAQTWQNWRIIIADDGSTDLTSEIVLKHMEADKRISTVGQQHIGLSAVLNLGIKTSTADYIAFLDSDDLWQPEKLEKQMQHLAESTSDLCFCLVKEFETFNKNESQATHSARKQPIKGYFKTAFLCKASVFATYGLFDETVKLGDFVEWYSRVIRAGQPVIMIEEVLAFRRVHHNNTSLSGNKHLYLQLVKAHLDKTRKNNS